MIKGLDVFKRRMGSIATVMDQAPQDFQRVGETWAERHWKPTALLLSPEDTGEYKARLGYEVTQNQITLKAEAPHSEVVEWGSVNHIAHMPVTVAVDMERDKISAMTRDIVRSKLK